jgi:hypothetical protein
MDLINIVMLIVVPATTVLALLVACQEVSD